VLDDAYAKLLNMRSPAVSRCGPQITLNEVVLQGRLDRRSQCARVDREPISALRRAYVIWRHLLEEPPE